MNEQNTNSLLFSFRGMTILALWILFCFTHEAAPVFAQRCFAAIFIIFATFAIDILIAASK